ncbi:MAG: hypothetical protein AMXMBFR55_33370 [Gemmatimonadota bacterium]
MEGEHEVDPRARTACGGARQVEEQRERATATPALADETLTAPKSLRQRVRPAHDFTGHPPIRVAPSTNRLLTPLPLAS